MAWNVGGAARLVLVRLRFVVVFLLLLVVVGYWDHLRNHWDRLTQVGQAPPRCLQPLFQYILRERRAALLEQQLHVAWAHIVRGCDRSHRPALDRA